MTNTSSNIHILYFASLGEQLGITQESLSLDNIATVKDLIANLSLRSENWAEKLSSTKIKCAVNHTVCNHEQPLNTGDEVAFFPPVTGG